VLAGYFIGQDELDNLANEIGYIKEKHGLNKYDPVKWNMKDSSLSMHYRKRGSGDRLDLAIKASKELRRDLLLELRKRRVSIIACALIRYSRETQPREYILWASENFFQRAGLLLRDRLNSKYPTFFVLDWPTRKDPSALLQAYEEGFIRGMTKDSNQRYDSGPLSQLGAFDSLLFGKTNYLPFLQMADIVAGATREFLDWAYKDDSKNKKQRVKDYFGVIACRFYRDKNGKISGCGLKVSPNPPFDLDAKIREVAQ